EARPAVRDRGPPHEPRFAAANLLFGTPNEKGERRQPRRGSGRHGGASPEPPYWYRRRYRDKILYRRSVAPPRRGRAHGGRGAGRSQRARSPFATAADQWIRPCARSNPFPVSRSSTARSAPASWTMATR